MKFLLVLLGALLGIGLWRSHRASRRKPAPPPPQGTPAPLDMVRCPWCSVHVSAREALAGQKGAYCCADHRRRAEP